MRQLITAGPDSPAGLVPLVPGPRPSSLGVPEVFGHALRGEPCLLLEPGRRPTPLPAATWRRSETPGDRLLLDLCHGATLDVGCGPGRLTAALRRRGQVALGIDVVEEAVRQTLGRGAPALLRDVHGRVPSAGRWDTVLLADGNVGIGGDPVTLLRRCAALVRPGGRLVVEVGAPGAPTEQTRPRLRCGCGTSETFAWARVGADGIGAVVDEAGPPLVADPAALHDDGGRWVAVLTTGSAR